MEELGFEEFMECFGSDPDFMLMTLCDSGIKPSWYSKMFPNCAYEFPWLPKDQYGFVVNPTESLKYASYEQFDLSEELPQVEFDPEECVRDREVEDVIFSNKVSWAGIDLDFSKHSTKMFQLCTCSVYPGVLSRTIVYDYLYYTDWLFKMVWRYIMHIVYGEFGLAGIDDFIISKVPSDIDGRYHVASSHRRDGFTALGNMVKHFALTHKDKIAGWKEKFQHYSSLRGSAVLTFPSIRYGISTDKTHLTIYPFEPVVVLNCCTHSPCGEADSAVLTPYPSDGPLQTMKLFVETYYDGLKKAFSAYQRLDRIYRMVIANRVKLGETEQLPETRGFVATEEDHADSIALQGGIRLVPKNVTVVQIPPVPPNVKIVVDPVFKVRVGRRPLSALGALKAGSVAHSALFVETKNGETHVVEYMADGKVHTQRVENTEGWVVQENGATLDRSYSVEEIRNIMTAHTASKPYNIHTHNCHLAQERTRQALGLTVANPYKPLW